MLTNAQSREDLLKVVDNACAALQQARDRLRDLNNCGLPEDIADQIGEENADEYLDSLDDALFNVKTADEQFDRCYAILAGECDD